MDKIGDVSSKDLLALLREEGDDLKKADRIAIDKEIADRISKNKSIWACGHSLGGAMATILAQRLEYKDGHDIDTMVSVFKNAKRFWRKHIKKNS